MRAQLADEEFTRPEAESGERIAWTVAELAVMYGNLRAVGGD